MRASPRKEGLRQQLVSEMNGGCLSRSIPYFFLPWGYPITNRAQVVSRYRGIFGQYPSALGTDVLRLAALRSIGAIVCLANFPTFHRRANHFAGIESNDDKREPTKSTHRIGAHDQSESGHHPKSGARAESAGGATGRVSSQYLFC